MDYFGVGGQRRRRTFVIDTGLMPKSRQSASARSCAIPWRAHSARIDANAVEDVILTHLHYDHVGNFDRFPKRGFISRNTK